MDRLQVEKTLDAPIPFHIEAVGPRDLILAILGSNLGFCGPRLWSGGLVSLLGEFGFSSVAARAALGRMVRGGLLERHQDGRRVYLVMTRLARRHFRDLGRRLQAFGRSAPMSDVWELLCHTIPEQRKAQRLDLASRLRDLGFGSVKDAIWLAAGDHQTEVRSVIDRLELGPYVATFIGQMTTGSELALLATGAWEFEGLRWRYDRFLEEFLPYRAAAKRSTLDARCAFICRTNLISSFRALCRDDPELPDEIVPLSTRRKLAVEVFDTVHRELAEAAGGYFATVIKPARSES